MLSPDDDFSLVYYMGQCQMGLKNIKMATELFNTVVTYSQNEKVKEMATAYLDVYKRQMHRPVIHGTGHWSTIIFRKSVKRTF